MGAETEILTTIDDYLLSLADGIALAQRELSQTAASGPPGQQVRYYIPKLDFELRMKVRVVQDQNLSERYRSTRSERSRDTHLLFSPANPNTTTHTETDVLSVVTGSFVAVPVNDGLPAVLLRTLVGTSAAGAPEFTIVARSAAGELLSGIEVQFNLDREETAKLSGKEGQEATILASGTTLSHAVVITNAAGEAKTSLVIDAAQPTGDRLAVVVDAAQRTEVLVYEVA